MPGKTREEERLTSSITMRLLSCMLTEQKGGGRAGPAERLWKHLRLSHALTSVTHQGHSYQRHDADCWGVVSAESEFSTKETPPESCRLLVDFVPGEESSEPAPNNSAESTLFSMPRLSRTRPVWVSPRFPPPLNPMKDSEGSDDGTEVVHGWQSIDHVGNVPEVRRLLIPEALLRSLLGTTGECVVGVQLDWRV